MGSNGKSDGNYDSNSHNNSSNSSNNDGNGNGNGNGKVYIVGAGPGDPGLLTIKALKVIEQADVVLYDRLVSDGVLGFIPEHVEKVYVGREVGDDTTHQDTTNMLMLKYAREGKKVVRLKGGDPFIFGRGGEEAEFLVEHGIEFEIVPGITSAIAAPAYAGIPLTHRAYSSSLAIITGHEATKDKHGIDIAGIAKVVDTLVVLMGISNLKDIVDTLLSNGIAEDTPIAIVEYGTVKDKQRVTISTLKNIVEYARDVRPPAVIVIGRTVDLAEKLRWYKGCKYRSFR
ncbi:MULTISPECIES: uroporphyrinogen-III C-methyltransferase [Candidatus Nitrosocaldus]|jgi:uroporphyrin-III C-methyltransferase|uniref:uroporphyrinogen-III C-methyltransferase n=1 Tax=Candidatus Nitrosocaldus cavascurensis TaxID=2058097 RepID=A0A2K5AP57_9ARCH|nr:MULTISPECIES: uroporphyrinogen-III C-methyltransferase [Candidatus Nitrosocaldus]SPC33420.1 Uroporphyrinogen-III C-methyltransferase [Candidatus Nitrosocaldus cavascurensis]